MIKVILLLTQMASAAYVPNPVGSSLSTARLEWVYVTNSGACAISSQSGAFSGTTLSGGGNCTTSIYPGIFSSAPSCTCTTASGGVDRACSLSATSTTSVDTWTFTANTGVAANVPFYLICVGSR
jgi:hypothetical protein